MKLSNIKGPTKNYPDPRLKDSQFRADVRLVLDAKEGESVLDEFMKYRDVIDWTTYARNIRKPRFGFVLKLVQIPTVEVLHFIEGRDRDEAKQAIDTENYLFVRDW